MLIISFNNFGICEILKKRAIIPKKSIGLPSDMQPDMVSGMGIARKLLLRNESA